MGRQEPAEILRESGKLSSTAWENVFVFSCSTAFHSIVTASPALRIAFLKGFALVYTRKKKNQISEYLVIQFVEHIAKVFHTFFWKSFFV